MGNSNSESPQGYIQDSRYGLIKIQANNALTDRQQIASQDTNEIVILRNSSMSISEYERWKKAITIYEPVRELLLLPYQTEVVEKSFCGNGCIVDIKLPSYRILLREEIRNRWKIDRPYSEAEIWNLLYSLMALGQHYEKIGEKMGDIHPTNVVFNEDGFMKIIGKVSLPVERDNFQKICESQLSDVFLAPEEIDEDCFEKHKYPPGVDKLSAEIFSIGMTILQAGTLEQSTYIYDRRPYRINFNKLKTNMDMFQVKYSFELFRILDNMLSKKASNRRTCKDLYQSLKPYEAQILNMEPFQWKSRFRSGSESIRQSSLNNSQLRNSQTIINEVTGRKSYEYPTPSLMGKPISKNNQLSKVSSEKNMTKYNRPYSIKLPTKQI